ncbi:hypothetical protein [Shouchella shacheensis]|uniref:hypothetical protein n=1 Tax=Shouchella shacheensis TaxID=1649580 RepID=UPI000B16D58A|nr:hypothetical protein [Shouchella shacheensis]
MNDQKMKPNAGAKIIGRTPEKYSRERLNRNFQQRLHNLDKVVKIFEKEKSQV